jgi:hypothetical protein
MREPYHYDPAEDAEYIDRDFAAEWRRRILQEAELDSLMRALPGEDYAPDVDPRIIHLGQHLGPTWQRILKDDLLAQGGWRVERVSTKTEPQLDSPLLALLVLCRWFGRDQLPAARRGRPARDEAMALTLLGIGVHRLMAAGFTSRALQIATGRRRQSVWRLRQRGAATLRELELAA